MGSIATLRMALLLPEETRKFIVLVAPALRIAPAPALEVRGTVGASSLSRLFRPIRIGLQKYLVNTPLTYILRRAVGQQNFWKRGLMAVWGDSSLLTDSDVLRFQWPAIGQGWERGLIKFSGAQFLGREDTDQELLEKVLALPNTSVTVIYGSSDRVIRKQVVKKFFEPYPQVQLVELNGRGHDPFEENSEEFVSTVEKILKEEESITFN